MATRLLIALILAILVITMMPGVADAQTGGFTIGKVRDSIRGAVQLLITVAGTVVVAYMVYGGMTMAMSAGNTTKFEQGKKIVINAIIGLVVILGVGAILATIARVVQSPGQAL